MRPSVHHFLHVVSDLRRFGRRARSDAPYLEVHVKIQWVWQRRRHAPHRLLQVAAGSAFIPQASLIQFMAARKPISDTPVSP